MMNIRKILIVGITVNHRSHMQKKWQDTAGKCVKFVLDQLITWKQIEIQTLYILV